MNREDVLQLVKNLVEQTQVAEGVCYIHPDDLLEFAKDIRSATKEEDAGICEGLKTDGGGSPSDVSAWEVGTLDCAIAIRASK